MKCSGLEAICDLMVNIIGGATKKYWGVLSPHHSYAYDYFFTLLVGINKSVFFTC